MSAGKANLGTGWCISLCNPYILSHPQHSEVVFAHALALRSDQARRPGGAQSHPDCAAHPRPRAPRIPREFSPLPWVFDPIKLGALEAPNRILMAPLTRGRSTRDHVPTELMKTYYSPRAGAGLFPTE